MNKKAKALRTPAANAAGSLKKRIIRHWQLYLIILLPLIYLFVFKYKPMLGIQIAFRDYNFRDGIWNSPWAGMKHFINFFKSPQFSRVMVNTLGLSLYNIGVGIFPPIIMALALSYVRNRFWGKTVQMVTYMPYFISTVLVVGILNQIFSLNGPVNNLIVALGGEKIHFMGEAKLFKTMYVFSDVWRMTGYNAVIYISALAAVDQQLHEAATVDGATIWQRIWHIDIPSILPTAVILLIMSCGKVLSLGYEKVLLMQNDMNMQTADIISTYVYRVGLQSMQYSYSTAIGLFQSVVSLILLVSVNAISKRVNETSLW
ncbi:MAG: sugar ABC transporter permease [Lachnospiraceae bacterium]|nr:sugar ABC transporter permease [Lachnospiraceae bacterium]